MKKKSNKKHVKNTQSPIIPVRIDYHATLMPLIDNIKKISGPKIVTLVHISDEADIFDISSKGEIGYNIIHYSRFLRKLNQILLDGGVVMIRQFTGELVTETRNGKTIKVPYKNLYGLLIKKNAELIPLSKVDLIHACSYSAEDGSEIELEPNVDFYDTPSYFFD